MTSWGWWVLATLTTAGVGFVAGYVVGRLSAWLGDSPLFIVSEDVHEDR